MQSILPFFRWNNSLRVKISCFHAIILKVTAIYIYIFFPGIWSWYLLVLSYWNYQLEAKESRYITFGGRKKRTTAKKHNYNTGYWKRFPKAVAMVLSCQNSRSVCHCSLKYGSNFGWSCVEPGDGFGDLFIIFFLWVSSNFWHMYNKVWKMGNTRFSRFFSGWLSPEEGQGRKHSYKWQQWIKQIIKIWEDLETSFQSERYLSPLCVENLAVAHEQPSFQAAEVMSPSQTLLSWAPPESLCIQYFFWKRREHRYEYESLV